MVQLTKEQKIKLIADIQDGLIPDLITEVIDSSVLVTQSEVYKMNGFRFHKDDYIKTTEYMNDLGFITVDISASDNELVQKLMAE